MSTRRGSVAGRGRRQSVAMAPGTRRESVSGPGRRPSVSGARRVRRKTQPSVSSIIPKSALGEDGQLALTEVSVGVSVWAPDVEKGWKLGEVTAVDGDEVVLAFEDDPTGAPRFKKDAVHISNAQTLLGVEDVEKLSHIHEPALLANVEYRFLKDKIYTYTGDILISVNPYKMLPLYTTEVMDQYKNRRKQDVPPHVYHTADAAYRAMLKPEGGEAKNQSLICSGESGAGKTVATKAVLRYYAHVASRDKGEGMGKIERQILDSNPVLEAYGNAKTLRNNNSSRFGKFIELQFDEHGHILGASIVNYLLEKSRLVHQAADERNFHIFYQMTMGADADEKKRYHLTDPEDYHYINQSGCMSHRDSDDKEDWLETKNAMKVLGFTDEQRESVLRLTAAILHAGNITFEPNDSDKAVVANMDTLKLVADLMKLKDPQALADALTTRRLTIAGEVVVVPISVPDANNTRDAFAKMVYGRMFDWLVEIINTTISAKRYKSFIGILDIFGFEVFEENSFEQFCINFANEKLQQQFNDYTFKRELREYAREKIHVEDITFIDNQPVLDLIEKKPAGVLFLLDEECIVPKGSDNGFNSKLRQSQKDHKDFKVPKLAHNQFGIAHYAGDVFYDVEGFLEKNKDTIFPELMTVLRDSNCSLLNVMFEKKKETKAESQSHAGRNARNRELKKTVGTAFKQQLATLIEKLSSTTPHYVRCIKSNQMKEPETYEHQNILHQFRCAGLLESIRIRKSGYPSRLMHREFYDKYYMLVNPVYNKTGNDKMLAEKLVQGLGLGPAVCQLGVTKVFSRMGLLSSLEDVKAKMLFTRVQTIQKMWRGHVAYERYKKMKKAIVQMQRVVRGYVARAKYGPLFAELRARMEESRRRERERMEAEEKERQRLEQLRIEEEERAKEAERKRQEELARLEKERKQAEEEAARREMVARAEAERLRKEQEEIARAEKARQEEERLRAEAEAKRQEEELRAKQEKEALELKAKQEQEEREMELLRIQEKAEEEKREAEAKREAERIAFEADQERKAEAARIEQERLTAQAEEARLEKEAELAAAEAARRAEEERIAQEKKLEEARIARQLEEQRAAEAKKAKEEKERLEAEESERRRAFFAARKEREEEEARKKAEAEAELQRMKEEIEREEREAAELAERLKREAEEEAAEQRRIHTEKYNAADLIQKNWRRFSAVKQYQAVLAAVPPIQRMLRGWIVRMRYKKEIAERKKHMANVFRVTPLIQAQWRRFVLRRKFVRERKAIVQVQRIVRGFVTRTRQRDIRREVARRMEQYRIRKAKFRLEEIRLRKEEELREKERKLMELQAAKRRAAQERRAREQRMDKDLAIIRTRWGKKPDVALNKPDYVSLQKKRQFNYVKANRDVRTKSRHMKTQLRESPRKPPGAEPHPSLERQVTQSVLMYTEDGDVDREGMIDVDDVDVAELMEEVAAAKRETLRLAVRMRSLQENEEALNDPQASPAAASPRRQTVAPLHAPKQDMSFEEANAREEAIRRRLSSSARRKAEHQQQETQRRRFHGAAEVRHHVVDPRTRRAASIAAQREEEMARRERSRTARGVNQPLRLRPPAAVSARLERLASPKPRGQGEYTPLSAQMDEFNFALRQPRMNDGARNGHM